jgi:hypothetical protein
VGQRGLAEEQAFRRLTEIFAGRDLKKLLQQFVHDGDAMVIGFIDGGHDRSLALQCQSEHI